MSQKNKAAAPPPTEPLQLTNFYEKRKPINDLDKYLDSLNLTEEERKQRHDFYTAFNAFYKRKWYVYLRPRAHFKLISL